MFLVVFLVLFLLIICSGPAYICSLYIPFYPSNVFRSWFDPNLKPVEEELSLLEPFQVACIEEVTESYEVIFIQPHTETISVGFTSSSGVFAALIQSQKLNECEVVFQYQLLPWQEDWGPMSYDPWFFNIKEIELTADDIPEIYIEISYYIGLVGRSTQYLFFIKDENDTYKPVFDRIGCKGWSYLQFIEAPPDDRPNILFVNDVRCDERRGKLGTYYEEFYLTNDGRVSVSLKKY